MNKYLVTIVYVENAGKAVPDYEAEEFVMMLVNRAKEDSTPKREGRACAWVRTENVISAARALVVMDGIKVQFRYCDELIQVDKDGRLDHYPEGFCDRSDFWMDIILNAGKRYEL